MSGRSKYARPSLQPLSAQSPPYAQVKDYVLKQIQGGAWLEGEMIPSESQLAEQFGLSRMTINRALRELTADQILHRVQGTGTFVALRKYESTVVEIRSLAHEIADRGHQHRAVVFTHNKERSSDAVRALFERKHNELFHSIIVHYENGAPIQVEDRYVNPALFPQYLAQDFTQQTPNEYLTHVAPIERVEFRIEALMPDNETITRLVMTPNEPCLVLNRRTWSFGQVASVVALWHPGSRYRFSGSF
jgi:GntR family transcriptional regulator, histidine utilization repressor